METSYVLGQIPSNMIIGYLRPSLYLCLMATMWSGVLVAMCGTTDFKGLVLVRFFLGGVEAPLLPGAVYLMGCWYTRREMAMRVAVLYTGQPLAYCASGLITAAVFGTLDMVLILPNSCLIKAMSLVLRLTSFSRDMVSLAGMAVRRPRRPWHRPCLDCSLGSTRLPTLTYQQCNVDHDRRYA
jgi:hypothetical protein